MKVLVVLAVYLFSYFPSMAQMRTNPGSFISKEFNKEVALYKAKEFVMDTVLGLSNSFVKFQIDPLAAASSGEMTSLVYKCAEKNKEGLVLGFFGSYWNEAGVEFQGYSFKNIPKENAISLLNSIEKGIDDYSKYLLQDDHNNIYFHAEDMTFLIYNSGTIKIRVFWNNFDSEWVRCVENDGQ